MWFMILKNTLSGCKHTVSIYYAINWSHVLFCFSSPIDPGMQSGGGYGKC